MASIARSKVVGSLAASLVILLACDSPSDPGANPTIGEHLSIVATGGLHFMTQDVEPAIVMEALYSGEVSADAAGCIRIPGPDPATVVWPKGFTLRSDAGEAVVVRHDGFELGALGGDFTFGGGYVTDLHDGLGFSASDRALARERCLGPFWIVGAI